MDERRLADLVEWDSIGLGHFHAELPLTGERTEFVLFPADGAGPQATDRMAETVADVLKLGAEDRATIESMLWDECRFSFQVADYGVEVLAGETSLQAHLREFGIASPEDAWRKAKLDAIHINDGYASRFAELQFDTAAHNRISVIVKDGRIIDYDDDGTHLKWFEQDERHAHKKRLAVLK